MNLLLLTLLGLVSSAICERGDRWPSTFRQIRYDDDEDNDGYSGREAVDREKLINYVETFDPGRSISHESNRYDDDQAHPRGYVNSFRFENPETHHPIRHGRRQFRSMDLNAHVQMTWPVKKEAVVEGDLVLGGLMMVHEREDTVTCGPVMPQGGVQALEAMLYTLDKLNEGDGIVPGVKIGAHILDDCDKDTYGLEMAVDFIKGEWQ